MKYCIILWLDAWRVYRRAESWAGAPASHCQLGLLVPLEAAGCIAIQESRAPDHKRCQGDAPQHTAPPTPPPAGAGQGTGERGDNRQRAKS